MCRHDAPRACGRSKPCGTNSLGRKGGQLLARGLSGGPWLVLTRSGTSSDQPLALARLNLWVFGGNIDNRVQQQLPP
jgi:hypothetical protein